MITPQQKALIKSEITGGPLATSISPYVASGNDGGICSILNAANISAYQKISADTFAIWAANSGTRAIIEDTANNMTSPLRASALALRDLLAGLTGMLDLGNPTIIAMLQSWVTAGAITAAQKDSLMALGATNISRAQQINGQNPDFPPFITPDMIGQALR